MTRYSLLIATKSYNGTHNDPTVSFDRYTCWSALVRETPNRPLCVLKYSLIT